MIISRFKTTTIKDNVKYYILRFLQIVGYYAPHEERVLQRVRREALPYLGDVPLGSTGDELGRVRYRWEYETPRQLRTVEKDILYTERGTAWKDGCLHREYSMYAPGLKDLAQRPSRRQIPTIPQGTIIQTFQQHLPSDASTYGDWIAEQFSSLAVAGEILPPLLLPIRLMERAYVRRDLSILGFETMVVETPIHVREMLVLYKPIYSHHWSAAIAEACRRAYRADCITPRPGSAIYLSRSGESAASVPRSYPHEIITSVMEELGVKVVLARETSLEDYRRLAIEAETVIADHGSALCNLLLWQTRNVIELYTNDWWNGYFFFLAKALGVSNYVLLNIDRITRAELASKLNTAYAQIGLR